MVGENQILVGRIRKKETSALFIGLNNPKVKASAKSEPGTYLKNRTEDLLKELQEMNNKEGNSFNVGSFSKREMKFTLNALEREGNNDSGLPVSFLEKLVFFGVVTCLLSALIIGFLSFMTYLLAY